MKPIKLDIIILYYIELEMWKFILRLFFYSDQSGIDISTTLFQDPWVFYNSWQFVMILSFIKQQVYKSLKWFVSKKIKLREHLTDDLVNCCEKWHGAVAQQ